MFKIGNDLLKAYVGYHEDEWTKDLHEAVGGVNVDDEAVKSWMETKAIQTIINHTPKQRLEIYLEWNGIIGYSSRIYEVAIGHF